MDEGGFNQLLLRLRRAPRMETLSWETSPAKTIATWRRSYVGVGMGLLPRGSFEWDFSIQSKPQSTNQKASAWNWAGQLKDMGAVV